MLLAAAGSEVCATDDDRTPDDGTPDDAAGGVVVTAALLEADVPAAAELVCGVAVLETEVAGAELAGADVAGADVAAEVGTDCVGDALVGAGALVDACCVSCIGEVGRELDGRSVGSALVVPGSSVVTDGLGAGLPVAETSGTEGDSSEGTASVMGGIDGSVVGAGVGTNSLTEGSTV